MRSVCVMYAWYGGRNGVYAMFMLYKASRFRCINIVFTGNISQ